MTGSAMDWRKRLQTAVALHQAGRLAEAISAYREVLTERPDHADALHLLGMALEQAGAAAEGRSFVERAIALEPWAAAYRNSLGNIHRALGDTGAARLAYMAALELDPRLAEALDNLGLLDQAAGDWPAALGRFEAALAADPGLLSAQFNLAATRWMAGERVAATAALSDLLRRVPAYAAQVLGLAKRCAAQGDAAGTEQLAGILGAVLPAAERHALAGLLARQRGDLPAAEAAFQAALALAPGHPEALPMLAGLLIGREAYAEAIPFLQRRLSAKPGDQAALTALASALARTGASEAAILLLRQALAGRPDDMALLADLATCLDRTMQLDAAADVYRAMIALRPEDAPAYANLAGLEVRRGQLDAARAAAEKAVALLPDSRVALGNLANIRGLDKRFDEAIEIYRGLLARDPQDADSSNNLALLLLRLRRYAEAWPYAAARWRSSTWTTPDRSRGLPRWDGAMPLSGRLLVWREQGIGDEILYAGLIPDLIAKAGPDIVLAVDPRLVPLYARSFPAVTVVADDGSLDPRALGLSCQIPAGDVGPLLRPDAASFAAHPAAYLKADAARRASLRQRYAEADRQLVGISWASRNRAVGHRKSLSLEAMAPFLREPGCSFVSLQYGAATEEIEALRRSTGLVLRQDPGIDPLQDIDAQAAQIAALDLVVTVSTAAAHLAAALGVPTLILLPDSWGQLWYWGEDGERTPWYPNVRLCRIAPGQDVDALIGRGLTMFRQMRAAMRTPGL
ncbi:MAG: tetratricopeptide repeat protein [Ferrovibrio sp.]